MQEPDNKTATRRDFMRGAAGVLGAALVAGSPSEALAQARPGLPDNGISLKPGSLYFVDGTRLIDASSLPVGEPGLATVQVRVLARGTFVKTQRLDALLAPGTSFTAWTASPNAVQCVQFNATVDPDSPLRLRTNLALAEMTTSARRGPKLRQGNYIWYDENQGPVVRAFDAQRPASPLLEASGGPTQAAYLWLTVTAV